ncbi:MAG: hypothetical protein V3S24_08740 [Candidatus Tectomicrobia bacterium]
MQCGRWWLMLMLVVIVAACGSGTSGFDAPPVPPPSLSVNVLGEVNDGTLTSPIGGSNCQFETFTGEVLAQAVADGTGQFQIELPVASQGFIQCTPPGLPQLVLRTFVSTMDASAGETLPVTGRELVSPATTLFSQQIADNLADDLDILKQNFLLDSLPLMIRTVRTDGQLSSFVVEEPENVEEPTVGLSVFSATSLYNGFFQQDIDVDFPTALARLLVEQRVESDSLVELGLPTDQAEALGELVNNSIDGAAEAFDLSEPPPSDEPPLEAALSAARLRVLVVQQQNDQPIPGAILEIADDETRLRCENCPVVTNDDGTAILRLQGVSSTQAQDISVVATVPDTTATRRTVSVIGLATVNVTIPVSFVSRDDRAPDRPPRPPVDHNTPRASHR